MPGSCSATRCGDLGVQVLQVGELRPVELLEDAGLDLPLEKRRRRHDDVVARAPGQQLGLQDLVGVEDVVLDRNAGLFLEVLDDGRVDVVRPVVDVEHLLGVGLDGGRSGCGGLSRGSRRSPRAGLLASARRRPRSTGDCAVAASSDLARGLRPREVSRAGFVMIVLPGSQKQERCSAPVIYQPRGTEKAGGGWRGAARRPRSAGSVRSGRRRCPRAWRRRRPRRP